MEFTVAFRDCSGPDRLIEADLSELIESFGDRLWNPQIERTTAALITG